MRRTIIPTVLALMLVALATAPAAASKPETRTVIPLTEVFGPVFNPCTETLEYVEIAGEWHVHALPSIEGFFTGDFKHMNSKFVGQVAGVDDGYATKWKNFNMEVMNQKADRYFRAYVENLMFYGDDGGKYRVNSKTKLVVVDGEVKVDSQLINAVCVQHPNS